jgi:hypothetical protein
VWEPIAYAAALQFAEQAQRETIKAVSPEGQIIGSPCRGQPSIGLRVVA